MSGDDNTFNYISLSYFLEKADNNEVEKFKKSLSTGDGRRVQFWRESVAANDHIALESLLHDNCKDGSEQLKDVRPDDEEDFKFKDSFEEAQRYTREIKSRMEADLQAEFSKPWPEKDDALKKIETLL